jgi:nicotinamidase-related amidase
LAAVSTYTDPDFSRCALITIDTQCDVLDGAPCEIPGTSAVLPRMARLCAAFRARSLPIVHIVRLYEAHGGNVDLVRREAIERGAQILIAGTPGSELASSLLEKNVALDTALLLGGGIQHLGPSEVVIYKSRWGAFYRTPLEDHLRGLDVSTLVFCGCNFPNCPRTSIYQASERDFRIALATDAISGLYERGEQELSRIGVTLIDSTEVASAVATGNAAAASAS